MAQIKVGIVGYGNSAKNFHLPFIFPNPDLQVVAFLQRAEAPHDRSHIEPGQHCTVDRPDAKHYRTPEDFFADSAIDLVVVCSSSATHFELVVIEKPFTVSTAEADKLISLSKEKKRLLTIYQNRRYDSDFRTLQHLMGLNSNPFGKITEFSNHFDVDAPEWVTRSQTKGYVPGEGLMYGLGSHSIDQTLLLFGLPASVTAFTRVLRMDDPGEAYEDSFTIILQYDGDQKDLICTIKTTIVTPQVKQLKYWLRGTSGTFFKEGEDVQMENLMEFGMSPEDPGFGVEPSRYHGTMYTKTASEKSHDPAAIFSGKVTSQPGSYMDYYRDVVSAIRGEKELVVKPEQVRDGIRIIELARESAQKGVTVPWSSS